MVQFMLLPFPRATANDKVRHLPPSPNFIFFTPQGYTTPGTKQVEQFPALGHKAEGGDGNRNLTMHN